MKYQYGTVYAEATLKVRIKHKSCLNNMEEDDIIMDAMYGGNFEFMDIPQVDSFKIEDITEEEG